MSQKNKYRNNSTFKNRSYATGGEGSVFSNIKHMFSANSSANKQIAEMNDLQTELKEKLKTIDNSIDTFKTTYDKLVTKVSYIDAKIKNIKSIKEQCKKLNPSIVTSTENKDTENKGFFKNLFGSTEPDEPEEPEQSDKDKSTEPESINKDDSENETHDDDSLFKDESDIKSDIKSDIDTNPFSGILDGINKKSEDNTLDSNKQESPTNIFGSLDKPESPLPNPLPNTNIFGPPAQPVTPALPITPAQPVTPALPITPAQPVTPTIEMSATNPFSATSVASQDKKPEGTKGGIKKKNKKSTKKRRKSRR